MQIESDIWIVDFGSSEFRLGEVGNIDFTIRHPTNNSNNLEDIFNFISTNK